MSVGAIFSQIFLSRLVTIEFFVCKIILYNKKVGTLVNLLNNRPREHRRIPVKFIQSILILFRKIYFSLVRRIFQYIGSEDRTIALWDIRYTDKKVHSFENHSDSVLKVQWSPHNISVFCSASMDRRVNIWDLSKCNTPLKPEDEQDGPAELLFIHGGHR